MKKIDWYTYLRLSDVDKLAYPYTLINKKNQVQCYTEKEKRKYLTDLKKLKADETIK